MPDVLDASPYDALLLLSFGGPEGPDDVVPFLENVTRGRGIPKERLKEVGQHYFLFGGVSPINDQNRALLDALRKDFAEHGLDLPVYWGNRNWAPYLTDTLREMVGDGFYAASWSSPPAPTPRTRAAASTARTSRTRSPPWSPKGWSCRRSTSSGTTSTTPASSSPWSTESSAPSPSCPRRSGTARTSRSAPTRSPPPPPTAPGRSRSTATAGRTCASTWTWRG